MKSSYDNLIPHFFTLPCNALNDLIFLIMNPSSGMVEKYGEPGNPIEQLESAVPSKKPVPRRPSADSGPAAPPAAKGGSKSIADFREKFIQLIDAAAPVISEVGHIDDALEAKEVNATNGLETSTFTLCTRIRSFLPPKM